MSWENYTPFGVDSSGSNIGAGAVMKFVKPLVTQLYKDSNIPYADILNQVEDWKLYIGLTTSSLI